MNGMLVDGKKIAAQIEARLAREIRRLKRTAALRPSFFWRKRTLTPFASFFWRKRTLTPFASFCWRKNKPHLAVVLVGEDPASRVYVRKKEEAAARVGIGFSLYEVSSTAPQDEVLKLIETLNADPKVNGIVVQLPLPANFDEALVIDRVSSNKDVDGLTNCNFTQLAFGKAQFVPATAGAVLEVLRRRKVKISGARAVVIGRGKVAGMPIALALLANDATVTIAHSKTKNLAELTRQADILVSAVGQPHFIKPAMVKRGATVLDVGISRLPAQAGVDGKLYGDVDPAVEKKARFLTPVPGGIGPLTVVNLLENIFHAWKLQHMR